MEKKFFDIYLKPVTVYTKRLWRLPQREAIEDSLDCLMTASQA